MSQTNVIITSGSKNQIIHVPVVTSTTRSATPIEIVTSPTGSLTIKQTSDRNYLSQSIQVNQFSPKSIRSGLSNKDLFNEDNSEVKALYFNSESNYSREQLLLPTDTYIKEEIEDDEYEEYESIGEEDIEGVLKAKTQYKCSGCGKGFCYPGWLDKHKKSSPECRNAHSITEKSFKVTTNNTPISGNIKERTSLEGRLTELLCCPNEKCSFTTHWVQSLNKHTFTACKFKRNTEETPSKNTSKQNNNSDDNSGNVCHLCSKGFTDTEQHIQHMKKVHQIKLLYQCSECKMNFDNKLESETHIAEHNNDSRPRERLPRIPPKADCNAANGSQQYWTCESCNKTYLSIRSYEIHRTSCDKDLETSVDNSFPTQRPVNRPINSDKNPLLKPISSVKHFRREQIEAIHKYDYKCKLCSKEFDSSNGLCNHLSRRPYCRDWYYTNLPKELKKTNSLHLMPKKSKRFHTEDGVERNSQSSPTKLSSHSSIGLAKKADSRRSTYESTSISNEKTNSARCKQCRKIFVGKNPTVALANHLRGSTCVPTKYNASQKPEVVRSRILNKSVSNRFTQNRTAGENRFYCKLCPEMELKNRVSLGCHLTIYHSLPQVNVSSEKGDAFRCQTCSQIFDSKYFYNVHRQDCDLTSPYVGIISSDEISSLQKDSGLICGLCGKTGFSSANQLNIHQKYQCVKRNHNKAIQSKKYGPPLRTQKSGHKPLPKFIDNKIDPALRCDQCGRGPYNSYSHYMEHKKKYCNALKGVSLLAHDLDANRAKKSFAVETSSYDSAAKENFCLNPTIPRARKTINFANVNSPQVSHDSSAPMDIIENEAEEVVVAAPELPEVTKCSVCPEEFDDILLFIRHRLSHITEELTINEAVEGIECELCGARVHHYQRIQQHLILHLQNVQILKKKNLVEVLNKRSQEYIQSDIESDDEDGDASLLHCPYCKSEYSSRLELAEHIKKTCPFRYQCQNCNNTYSAKESYLEHREYCSKNTNNNKSAPKAPTYKCRNCNIEFQIKQQLLWHEHACNKIYSADHSGRVEEVIERTLTCSVCGLVSDVYERKVKHETQCLKRYLAVIGNSTEEIQSNGEDMSKPMSKMDFDLTSLSNTSESSEVPEEVINNLKEEFGIQKDLKVVLTGFDEEVIRKLKTDLYRERDETTQFEALKESFRALVRRLTKNDEVLHEMSQEASAELVLSRMLKYLGEEPIRHNGLNELNCFRQNLQTFLKLTIKDDTLILAYREAESVDEAIVNMLNFECEFNC